MGQFASQHDIEIVRQDLREHAADDKAFQERMFAYLQRRFDKLDTLWDEMNIQKGEENSLKKNDEKQAKTFGFAGWMINAFIGFVTAIATIKMIK